MLTPKIVVIISAMIDKMDLDISDIKGKDQKEVGTKLLTILVKRLYKAEDEVYRLIAEYKGITIEEAAKCDFIAVVKELVADTGITGLFT